ncbi:hypothetical protein [Yersinia enterocolitica]|uniref:hypothetical protein n=1 Tax=Yersinia enterocolitica TaxID=630 RepID=UPI000311F831|nr:hypothetical protein [Yersinia enterocolitica]
MRRFIMLSLSSVTLLIPAVSSALDVYGEIHPERYTFFLNDKGGDYVITQQRNVAYSRRIFSAGCLWGNSS